MSADAKGNNLGAVAIPVTGHIGCAALGTVFPTPGEGTSPTLTLDPAFKLPGLLAEDGGFEWSLEADGDPLVFWQDGFSLPTGLAKVTLVAKFAQTDEVVREITRGKVADSNGYMTIDGGGTSARYVVFTEEIFKNGDIRRRVAASATVQSVKEAKSERGKPLTYEVTFKIERSSLLENNHIGEWMLRGDALAITAATPPNAATAATVTVTGSGFTGTTGVKFGSTNATSFAVVSDTQITAVMPEGTAGSAKITVTTAEGTATFTYARG